MADPSKDAKQIVISISLVFLFIVAFWQSISGVFIFVCAFMLGGIIGVESNKQDKK